MINLQGFRLPAEWESQESTWLTFPQNYDTWYSNSMTKARSQYVEFVKTIALSQRVNLLVNDMQQEEEAKELLANVNNLTFHHIPTNDAWCRDYGPDFMINSETKEKICLNWGFNSWGGKYPPFDLDNEVPTRIAQSLHLNEISYDFILEGGSYEIDGLGNLLTTESCLLNANRNPNYSKTEIEQLLKEALQIDNIIWLKDGIAGDDTDGHIDDFCRFAPDQNVLLARDKYNKENRRILEENKLLLQQNLPTHEIIEIDLPAKSVMFEEELLPASYLNYIFTNEHLIVPIFGDVNDQKALEKLQSVFEDKNVVGLMADVIVIGLGGFHCLSKHEPKL